MDKGKMETIKIPNMRFTYLISIQSCRYYLFILQYLLF